MRTRRRSVSCLLVAGINPLWKLYPDACKLLLNSKSRGRIRGMLRTSRYPKSYNFGMLLILELINYISLSSSRSASSLSRPWTFPVFLSTSLAFVRWFYPTFPPPPALPIVSPLHHPSTPYAHTYTRTHTHTDTVSNPYLVYPSCGISAQATTRVSVGPVISCSN